MKNVLVVTGGGRGIGAAVSRLAATRGYAVCVNYRTDAEAARKVVQAITSEGGTASAVAADVSRQAEVERLFRTVDRELGRVTALVNNAGVVAPQGRVDQIDEERLTRIFTTNVNSAFLCSKEAVLRMSTARGGPGGAIVNVSSAASRLGSPGEYVDYAASKGAMDTLTTGLSLEVAAEGIRVNGVRPGSSARPCTRTAAIRAGWTACSTCCPWGAAGSRKRWRRPLSGFSRNQPRS